jgi:hypothetical protein
VIRAFRATAGEDQADAPAPEILWVQVDGGIVPRPGRYSTCCRTNCTIDVSAQ